MANRTVRPHTRGFTIIELAVVVGVLVFLIAMLMPALYKAQRQARTVTCLANVNELRLGYSTYLQNFKHGPVLDPTGKIFWLPELRPNLPAAKGMLLCPEASTPSYGWGSDKLAWGPFDAAHGSPESLSFLGSNSSSYGFNGWLYSIPASSASHSVVSTDVHNTSTSDGETDTSLDEKTPVFADAAWIDGTPRMTDAFPSDATGASARDNAGLARFYIARHGQSVNAAFLDGHAEQLPLEVLSQKIWRGPESSR